MECIYIPELSEHSELLQVKNEEFKHIKALRLREGDFISVSNGSGLVADMQLTDLAKDNANLTVCKYHRAKGELKYKLALGLGILSDRTRFEFALEKAVELGVTDFYPLITDFCEKKTISVDRLQLKAIAALKQSKRSNLTKIHQPIKFKDISTFSGSWSNIILADCNGIAPESLNLEGDTLLFVGPEGGFSKPEQDFLKFELKSKLLNLGNRRLRAETASISALSIISMKLLK